VLGPPPIAFEELVLIAPAVPIAADAVGRIEPIAVLPVARPVAVVAGVALVALPSVVPILEFTVVERFILRVANAILSAGESSRLYNALVYTQQIAAEVFSDENALEDAGLFIVGAILSEGKKPEDVEKALLAEIKKLQDEAVPVAELEKAKNQLITNQLRERETSNGKALALGEAAVLLGDPARVNTDLARLQAVTAADVQRVMKKYFTDENRFVLYYLPEASKPKKEGQ